MSYPLHLDSKSLEKVSLILAIVLIAVLGLVALDSFGNPETSRKIFGVWSRLLLLPLLLIMVGARLLMGVRLPEFLTKLLFVPLLVLVPLTAGLSIYWANSHENAVFELTRLHPEGLTLLTILISLAILTFLA